jgi:hypothetical protein
MFFKDEYQAYILDFLKKNVYVDEAYKGDIFFVRQMTGYAKYVITELSDNANNIDEKHIINMSNDLSKGFRTFKTYAEFTRKEKIKKIL